MREILIQVRKPVHPGSVMLFFWALLFLIYFLGPIIQTPAVSLFGFGFLLAHISAFVLGALLLSRVSPWLRIKKESLIEVGEAELIRDNRLIALFLCIGIVGSLLSCYAKISVISDFTLASAASLRTLRAQMLLNAGQIETGSLSAIAFLSYPAGFVGLVAGLIRYERLPWAARGLIPIYAVIVFFLAILAGGRSPILVLLIFMMLAAYARYRLGIGWLPKSLFLKAGISILLLVFLIYSSTIWLVRSEESGMGVDDFLAHAEDYWGVRPSKGLLWLSEWLGQPELKQSVLGSVFYVTQSLSITERILNSKAELSVLMGGYHIDLVAALMRALPGGANFLGDGYKKLLEADVYGFFAGAWGALFIDFGYFSILITLIWGYVAGRSWWRLKNRANFSAQTNYVFWVYTILISFVSPPFGFSNSFMIFVWFFIFGFFQSTRIKVGLVPHKKIANTPDLN